MKLCVALLVLSIGPSASYVPFRAKNLIKSTVTLNAGPDSLPETPDVSKVSEPRVFEVPVASRCVVIMCCQYMIVYTALAICRTYLEFQGLARGKVENALKTAAQTMTYAPMLCVLFIACRMRVEFLSKGKGEPQPWVQNCMYALTFAVLASTVLALVVPLLTGKPLQLKQGSPNFERPHDLDDSRKTFVVLTAFRYLILIGLYGGLLGVIVGMFSYLPPGETELDKLPMPAPAIMCTMLLAVMFFLTQIVIACCGTYTEFIGVELPKLVGAMNGAALTVEFAPMVCILFLAARMRALQHGSQPQDWAQQCMYVATCSLLTTTMLAVIVPLVANGTVEITPRERTVRFNVPNPSVGYLLLAVRLTATLAFYAATCAVAISIFTFEAPGGAKETLPISPTVQCVINLTCQFFFVYGMMTVMVAISEITSGLVPLDTYSLFSALEAAKATLALAPMLSILFVTTRMYALLITDQKGAPQAWVQDAMFMATWSLFISFWACLFTGIFMGQVETDEDGNVTNKFSNRFLGVAMAVIRYLSMFLLYCGVVTVIVGLFVMTPETANGRGSTVVSSAVEKTPIGGPPPGPNAAQEMDRRHLLDLSKTTGA